MNVTNETDFTPAQRIAVLLNDSGEAIRQRDYCHNSGSLIEADMWQHELDCCRELLASMGVHI